MPDQPTSDDPREALLKKMRGMYKRTAWDETAVRRRISRMSDKQVHASLAMSEGEIRTAADAARTEQRWAPIAGDGATVLWDHVDKG